MNSAQQEIINKYKAWYIETVIQNHIRNTKKLAKLSEFQVNPLLLPYLANFLEGNNDSKSLAKALIYPRALSTSITTTFGTAMQKFTTNVLKSFGSMIAGVDIEFVDQVDQRRKYCQLKAGPNTLNKDDIQPIIDKFKSARNLALTNNIKPLPEDFVLGLIYGENHEKNSFIRALEEDHPVYAGREFWYRLTGEEDFYDRLIKASEEVAIEIDMKALVDETIDHLALDIEKNLIKKV